MSTINPVFRRALTAVAVLVVVAVGTLDANAAVPAHGRAWELVTPPDPNGSPVGAVLGIDFGGDRLTYTTIGAPPGAQAGSFETTSFARRTPLGWVAVPIALPYSVDDFNPFGGPLPPRLVGADEDMSTWIWSSTFALTPDGPIYPNTGLYSSGIDGTPTLLADAGSSEFRSFGGSDDARHFVFETGAQLLPGDVRAIAGKQVYEIADGALRLVGVDSGGVPLSDCGAMVGSGDYSPNPVSRDGRRIFLSSPNPGCNVNGRRAVYLREDGAATTVISASRCARPSPACNAADDVVFMGATPSGAAAFLATSQQLTDDDVDAERDLYRYDVASGTLSRVSVGAPGVSASVTGSAAYPSDDGSRVYFVASGALVPGEGNAGSPNLYVSDDRGLRFVATINGSENWTTPENVQLTPDGGRLAFATTAALTVDDTDAGYDVYLYDAEDETLSRASGVAGSGNDAFDATIAQGLANDRMVSGYPPRSLSDDGRRLFFKTDESLVGDDVNTSTDVYEWADGDLGLVTSGAPSGSVRYRNASADGSSVFFTTDESLTPDDDDEGDPDLYVARVGGGFLPREQPPVTCVGDGCSPKVIERLARPVPRSVAFHDAAPGRLRILAVSAAARRRMAASGWLRLRVETTEPGRLVARALARVGGRRRVVARGQVSAGQGRISRLRLRLAPIARRRLNHGHTLLVRVALRRSRPDRVTAVLLKLEPST
jgi:hypothetical protein